MSRTSRSDHSAGFTLIEVLVALAVVAASLAAIGSVIGVTLKNVRSLEESAALTGTTREIMTSLPDRRDVNPGAASGAMGDYRWRIEVAPFVTNLADPGAETPWIPESIVLRVQSPTGKVISVNTLRLRPGKTR